ncbi:MAG: hypothetical protein ACE5MB_00420 [Anaerolineae bacterium]
MSDKEYYKLQATHDFQRARRAAFIQDVLAQIRDRPADLLPFEEVRTKLHLRSQTYRGLQQIPLDKIVGSVGRYRDFTRAFFPRYDELGPRWQRVDQLVHAGGLPPIEVYKVGEVYFVKDGNHRVSVARQQKAQTIEAHVWEYLTKVPLRPEDDLDDLLIKQEYVEFLNHTHLDTIRPEQQIEFTTPGRYRALEEHIAVHRYYLGLEQEREIPYEEAVASWYDNLYLPVVQAIREQGVLKEFPGRTEADLYVWIMDHLHYLREQYGPAVDAQIAATDFAEQFTEKPVKRVAKAVKRAIKEVVEPGEPSPVVEQLLDKLEAMEQKEDGGGK